MQTQTIDLVPGNPLLPHGYNNYNAFTNPPPCSVQSRAAERAELQQQVEEYLKKGGKITQLPSGETDVPALTEKEKRVIKTLYLRPKAKHVSTFPKSLQKAVADLKNKRLLWGGDNLVKLTARGHVAAIKLFPNVVVNL